MIREKKKAPSPQVRRIKESLSAPELHLPLCFPWQAFAFFDFNFLHFHDPFAAHFFDLGLESPALVESRYFVSAADRFAVYQDIGDRLTAGRFLECCL